MNNLKPSQIEIVRKYLTEYDKNILVDNLIYFANGSRLGAEWIKEMHTRAINYYEKY